MSLAAGVMKDPTPNSESYSPAYKVDSHEESIRTLPPYEWDPAA